MICIELFHVEHFSMTIIRELCPSNPSTSFDSIIRVFRASSWAESGISSGLFFKIILPPSFKKGRPVVKQVLNELNPRKKIRSNLPAKASRSKKLSARPSATSIPSSFRVRMASRKKLHRFPLALQQSQIQIGVNNLNGNPRKPGSASDVEGFMGWIQPAEVLQGIKNVLFKNRKWILLAGQINFVVPLLKNRTELLETVNHLFRKLNSSQFQLGILQNRQDLLFGNKNHAKNINNTRGKRKENLCLNCVFKFSGQDREEPGATSPTIP